MFGVDADYFAGLTFLNNGDEKSARAKFLNSMKKGSYYCSLRSAQALCTLGTVTEKDKACENLINQFDDYDSLYIASNQYYSSQEYGKLIKITDNIDFEKAPDKLIKLRLLALQQRKSQNYHHDVYKWFLESKISSEHYSFYRDYVEHPDFTENSLSLTEENYSPLLYSINYRIELYKKNYLYCYKNADKILSYIKDHEIPISGQLASDIGKAFLYGDSNFLTNADFFVTLAEQYKNTEMAFYFWFYAGRLFDKSGLYYNKSVSAFENAINSSNNSAQKDNAIWYLLNTSISYSYESVIEKISNYATQWTDPEYFEDFFDSLAVSLFSAGKWDMFGKIYKIIDRYASPSCTAQYAYIYARLIQERKIKTDENEMQRAFEIALNSGSQLYYKVISTLQLNKLGYSKNDIDEILNQYKKNDDKNVDSNAEQLLKGYAYFGFPEMIYQEWSKIGKNKFSDDCANYLSEFLQNCSTGNDDYLHQALRIGVSSKNTLSNTYPQNYKDLIEKYSSVYNLDSAVLYALVRSESFFDPDVISSAGAIGLTQLMEFTAGDIAQRLKITNYDLTDPETNIQFGAYYLADLVRRFDNSYLLAFFAYNAGAKRVRRWLQTSIIDFGEKSNMPLDLFLETLPYTETREYGRKLISATVIYEWLYSQTPDETAQELLTKLIKRN